MNTAVSPPGSSGDHGVHWFGRNPAGHAGNDNVQTARHASDFAFKVLVHIFAIAISTFDPALINRNLQPDTRMTQSPFTAITGNPVAVHDFDFGGFDCHRLVILLVVATLAFD